MLSIYPYSELDPEDYPWVVALRAPMVCKGGVNIPGPTAEETQLTKQQIELSKFQLEELQRQRVQQEEAFTALEPLITAQTKEAERQAKRAAELEPIQEELLNRQLEEIRRGAAASPEQLASIEEARSAALTQGESDIENFLSRNLELVRTELAPSRGLRPTDTPIQDVGFRLGTEAQRQQGQLASKLAESAATARLNFPLAASQLTTAQTQFQQNLAQASTDFAQQLQNAAIANRLALAQGASSAGLGLAGIPGSPSGLAASLASIRRPVPQQGLDFGGILGGGGGLLTGLGAVGAFGGGVGGAGSVGSALAGLAAFSDSRLKENAKRIGTLKITGLPVYEFNYVWNPAKVIGVMAHEVREVVPQAVSDIGGYLAVDYAMLRAIEGDMGAV